MSTVVHLHGARTPPEHDGYPLDLVMPLGGGSHGSHGAHEGMAGGDTSEGDREYVYPMQQRAATLWYHDHRMDFTGPAVWRGLMGFHLVRDDEEDALPLPSGAREVPLMICDRAFASDGSFIYSSRDDSLTGEPGVLEQYMDGVLGDVMLVNGAPWPVLEVAATTYRFRILNACNARRLELGLRPPPAGGFVQIGSDGGLLAVPVSHDTIPIAQAERFDVAVVDFSGYATGDEITLTNHIGAADMSEVMRFRITHQGPAPDPAHPIHLHQVPFKVLSRTKNDDRPLPSDIGWKDTIDLREGESARVLVNFDSYLGKYVFHCHNLEHEDMAMMANFQII